MDLLSVFFPRDRLSFTWDLTHLIKVCVLIGRNSGGYFDFFLGVMVMNFVV
jgi:hypothetical protein